MKRVRGAEHPMAKFGIEGCYVVSDDGCWNWQGYLVRGYGVVKRAGRPWQAHRYSWSLVNGPIPEAMTIDHLCFNTACVNPGHLRLLTRSENSSNRRVTPLSRTHCVQGHAFDEQNTTWTTEGDYLKRRCRACQRVASARARAKRRAASRGAA